MVSQLEGRAKLVVDAVDVVFTTHAGSEVPVFKNASLEIKEHEFVSIVGPSGCGKSTLVNLLAGLVLPTRGKIMMDGQPIGGPDRARGVVFQQDAVLPWRSVARNVEYGLELQGVPRRERTQRALECLKLVGLDHARHYFPKELSGGMRKRVHIAAVFANDPEVLMLDEPFASLDYPTKVELQNTLLRIWRNDKKTSVFVTHDLEEAVFLADRILAIVDGSITTALDVPFKRPRTNELRNTPEFQEAKQALWDYVLPNVEAN